MSFGDLWKKKNVCSIKINAVVKLNPHAISGTYQTSLVILLESKYIRSGAKYVGIQGTEL